MKGDPPKRSELTALRKYAKAQLAPLVKDLYELGEPNRVVATSKSFRSLARVAGAAPYSKGQYVRRRLTKGDLEDIASRLAKLTAEQRAELPGVSPRRSRQLLAAAGYRCVIAAPSKLVRPSSDRVKTDARDAMLLAKLLRMDELVAVEVPTPSRESARDLVRAREDVRAELMAARHRVSKLLLRHGHVYSGGRAWTGKHHQWLHSITFTSTGTRAAYEAAAESFRNGIERVKWEVAAQNARAASGPLVNRRMRTAAFTRSLPGAPEGEYVVFQFDARYDRQPLVTEVLTAEREKDGKWRVAGYLLR